MKRRNLTLFAIAVALCTSQLFAQQPDSADRIMKKVADKLATVKQLGYRYKFEYSFPSQDRTAIQEAMAILDLKPADGSTQFRFQFVSDDRVDTYNGAERFLLDKKGKKLYVESKPSFDSSGSISLMNSPLSMKFALPRIIADSSIQKKVSSVQVNGREQYLIEFWLPKRIVNSDGSIAETRSDNTNRFQLKVDKEILLPIEVIQTSDKNDEIIKTSYTEITERPTPPSASSWYYSTYSNEYALQKRDKLSLMGPGKIAPEFSLIGFSNDSKTSLGGLKGKVVLLEFWIAHCGFCISAVPKLNAFNQNYRDKGVEVISINMYDPTPTIETFKKKHKPEYTILTGGDSIATLYGVDAYPAFVLIDRSGAVVYYYIGLE